MSRTRFALSLCALWAVHLVAFYVLIIEQVLQNTLSDMRMTEVSDVRLRSLFALIVLGWWLLMFPTWRWLLRSRFRARERPLWWADVPGLMSLGLLGFVIAVMFAETEPDLESFTRAMDPTVVLPSVGGGLLLSVLVGFALTGEALRPDTRHRESDVFA